MDFLDIRRSVHLRPRERQAGVNHVRSLYLAFPQCPRELSYLTSILPATNETCCKPPPDAEAARRQEEGEGGKLGKGDGGKGRGAKARRQVGVAAVTSSVSSKMPLREERKVLSTAKPWSPAAAPSSGGPSRRFKALSISSGPTRHSPSLPPAQEGKQED